MIRVPICYTCHCEMICHKNEVEVTDEEYNHELRLYWSGDLYRCPICEARIIVDFGNAYTRSFPGETEPFHFYRRTINKNDFEEREEKK